MLPRHELHSILLQCSSKTSLLNTILNIIRLLYAKEVVINVTSLCHSTAGEELDVLYHIISTRNTCFITYNNNVRGSPIKILQELASLNHI